MAKSKSGQIKIIGALAIILLLILSLVFFIPFLKRMMPHDYYGVKQQAQLHCIDAAVEIFNSKFDYYPPSDALDPVGRPYCGAMKLAEAMVGQDLMGFQSGSTFRSNGTNGIKNLYPGVQYTPEDEKRGPILPIENGLPYRLNDLFIDVGPFDANNYVLCDVFMGITQISTGKKIGMPILYYKADTSKTTHDINDPNNPDNIYNYKDNYALLALGVPGQPGIKHPMYEDPTIFYKMTQNYRINTESSPFKADTFILLSAGKDGLYGTKDDIVNFEMQWKFKK